MLTVAVCGGSGSGKSYICQEIINAVGLENICYLSQDHYYFPRHLQPLDDNNIHNFDTLQSINIDHFVKDVKLLQNGNSIEKQEYIYNNPTAISQTLIFRPSKILLLDGLLLLDPPIIAQLSDIKIFVATTPALMMQRRIERDAVQRGYDRQDVEYRFANHVMPFYDKFINAFKSTANYVVPNDNAGADDMLKSIISKIMSMI